MIQGAGIYMPVEIMNPLVEDVMLYKNTHLGIVSSLPSLVTISSLEEKGSPGPAEETNSDLPRELEDLLNKINIEVDQEERSQIR